MFNFNLKKSKIYFAVILDKNPVIRFSKAIDKIFFISFLAVFLLFLYGFVPQNFPEAQCRLLLGGSAILFALLLGFRIKIAFFNSKIKKPKLKNSVLQADLNPENYNLAEFLSFESAKAIARSISFAKSKKIAKINSSLLFYFLLKDNPELNFIFSRLNLNVKEIKKVLLGHFKTAREERFTKEFSGDFQKTILASLKFAKKRNHQRVEITDVISALSRQDLVFKKIMIDNSLKAEDIENLANWLERLKEKLKKKKRFWDYENLAKRKTLAKEWTSGYTITLDKYSVDLTEIVRKSIPEIIGHKQALAMTERALVRAEKNNALIVGDAGTGRRSVIYELAKRTLLGKALPELNYRRVVKLNMPALITQTEDAETIEIILDRIFGEVIRAGNIILVIDEFENYVGKSSRPGVVDISGVLSPYLQMPQFKCVAITTYVGFHKYIERNPSILSLFEKIEISEISPNETLMLLENFALVFERRYKKFISYPALRETISLTSRYMPSLAFPEKALNVLEEAVIYASGEGGDDIVLPKHIAEIVKKKTEIPVGEIEIKEKKILLNLENLIHKRIINQEEAVKEVSTALRRARAGIGSRKGPMGCFLFLGPTGVGKTETSKALAEIYFGSESRMIRLDMSEFQDIKDIPRLIGSPTEIGLLVTPVRESPFSLILLDEIEKAHRNILHLFLQVLDEGRLTDGWGRKVDFTNSIIIATSNAGYKVILEALKEKTKWPKLKQKLLDELFEKRIFRPEFINRFDAVVVFKSLSKKNLLDIADLMFGKLKKNLEEKDIDFIITRPLKEKIVELGYSPVFGAREMKRVIQDRVENVLAEALLSDELKRGDKVKINPENFKLIINSIRKTKK